MTTASLYPAIRPSLLLDFANTRQLDPRVTFARASTATYYDGKSVAKAEENLCRNSEGFDNVTDWPKSGSTVTANTTSAPNGTTTADTITAQSGTVVHDIGGQTGITIAGGVYTASLFMQAGTHSFVQICVSGDGNSFANFDLSTGTVGTTGGTVNASIVNVGGGWHRCILIYTAISTAQFPIFTMVPSSSATRRQSWTAVGTETVFVWGAQLEQRSTVSSYTPTTLSPVTNYIPALQTAAAGVPRFDHDPLTGESKGLLIEEQRTNLLTYSEQFDNAAWAKAQSSVVTNTIVAPDGTLTGDKLTDATQVSGTSALLWTQTIANATVYTLSLYAKEDPTSQKRYLVIYANSGFTGTASYGCVFDLGSGTVIRQQNGFTGTITPVGNGWYRCSVLTTTSTSTSAGLRIALQAANVSIPTGYTGDGYSGIYIWGAQLEAGAFPTSYIPTVASQVTRSADSASMTGSNFSSWYRADEGTLFAEAATSNFGADRGTWAIGNGQSFSSGTFMYEVYATGTSGRRLVNSYTAGTLQVANFAPSTATETVNVFSKTAYTFAKNNFGQTQNGLTSALDNSGLVPDGVTAISIGNLSAGWSGATNYLNGTIKRLAFYPKRLSNQELQGITS